jgi:hypothetical protein
MPALPIELIERSFSFLPEAEATAYRDGVVLTPDYRTLATLARVWRRLIDRIRRLLYHKVVILNGAQWTALARSLKANPELRPQVKQLFVWCPRTQQLYFSSDAKLFPGLEVVRFMDRECQSHLLLSLARAAPKTLHTIAFSIEGETDLKVAKNVLLLHTWKKVVLYMTDMLFDKQSENSTRIHTVTDKGAFERPFRSGCVLT